MFYGLLGHRIGFAIVTMDFVTLDDGEWGGHESTRIIFRSLGFYVSFSHVPVKSRARKTSTLQKAGTSPNILLQKEGRIVDILTLTKRGKLKQLSLFAELVAQ